MRCLYCGKDLPLLKRLAKGEFCSEEHRQSYHQEYSQLALNRLLQSQPSDKSSKRGKLELNPDPVPSVATPVRAVEPVPARRPVENRPTSPPPVKRTPMEVPSAPASRIPPAPAAKRPPMPTLAAELPIPVQTIPQRVAPAPTNLPAQRSADAPKISLTPKQAGSITPALAHEPDVTLRVTEPIGRDSRSPARRWLPRKSDVATLAQALNAPAEAEPAARTGARVAESITRTTPEISALREALRAPTQHPPVHAEMVSAETSTGATPAPPSSPAQADFVTVLTGAARENVAPALVQPEGTTPAPLAGSVFVLPPVADAKITAKRDATDGPLVSLRPAMPGVVASPAPVQLTCAERLSSKTFVDPLKMPRCSRPVKVEFRDFARRELVFEFRSTIQGPRVDVATQPAALPFTPAASGAAPTLWVGAHLEFPPVPDHKFALVAIEGTIEEKPSDSPLAMAVRPEGSDSAIAAELPERSEPWRRAFDSADPQPVLSALPVAFAGIPGGRAKSVQVFTSTLRAPVVVDIPSYDALPMRPTMVLQGPANIGPLSEFSGANGHDRGSAPMEPPAPDGGGSGIEQTALQEPW
jgi:hypothetical protein